MGGDIFLKPKEARRVNVAEQLVKGTSPYPRQRGVSPLPWSIFRAFKERAARSTLLACHLCAKRRTSFLIP